MRRLVGIFLFFGLVLGSPRAATGQETPRLGLTLGMNVATLEAPGDVGVRQMAAGGVVLQMDLVGPLSAQPQLLLSQKGATVEGGGGSIRYGAGYVDLPVLLRVDGPTLGSVATYGLGGGFGGVKVFEQQRAGGDLSFPLDSGTSFFRRTNAGVSGGIGGRISMGSDRHLHLVLQYEHGLVDVAQSVEEQPYEQAPFPSSAETRTWSIMLRLGM